MLSFALGLLKGAWSLVSKYWLEILVAIVVIAVVWMIRTWGYNDGFIAGSKSRDKEVAQLKADIKQRDTAEAARVSATNEKIKGLEDASRDATVKIQSLQKELAVRQSSVIIRYRDRYPTVAQKCGWSEPTVDAIRELLEE